MAAYDWLPLKGSLPHILVIVSHLFFLGTCFLSFVFPSASDIQVPEMGQPGWFDKSKERSGQQFAKGTVACLGASLCGFALVGHIAVLGQLNIADERVKAMSDRASFARRKMLALGLTAAQGLELVALTTLILWFISMKLILASVAGVFLCFAVLYHGTHNMLKLYGPQWRDELRLRDVSLQQEAQLPPYEDEEAAEDVAFLYSDDPVDQQPKPYGLP